MSQNHRYDYYAYYAGSEENCSELHLDRLVLGYYKNPGDENSKAECRRQWKPPEVTDDGDSIPKDFQFGLLPRYSFAIRFEFVLARPYISKSDEIFHVLDNPLVRDKVFFAPMVRPSSWKGNLHSALWRLGRRKETDPQMQRLFGNLRGQDEEAQGQAGRLIFFPSFFTESSKEIINPHDRETRVGKNPILFECVPSGKMATFCLLYVPFDAVDQEDDVLRAQAAQDLVLIVRGLQAMMCEYGFSAKRSSGYGIIEDRVKNGSLTVRFAEKEVVESDAQLPKAEPAHYQDENGNLRKEYLNPDGTFRERTEAELSEMRKRDRQQYDKAKKAYERQKSAAPAPAHPSPPVQHWFKRQFASLGELGSLAEKIEETWKGEGQ